MSNVRGIFGAHESDSGHREEPDVEDHESVARLSGSHGMFGSSDRLFAGDLDGELAMLEKPEGLYSTFLNSDLIAIGTNKLLEKRTHGRLTVRPPVFHKFHFKMTLERKKRTPLLRLLLRSCNRRESTAVGRWPLV